MTQVTISPEGEVLIITSEGGMAFRSEEGVWSAKPPAGLTVEDTAWWRLEEDDEAKALMAEAEAALGSIPI